MNPFCAKEHSVKCAKWRIREAPTKEDPTTGNPAPKYWSEGLMEGYDVVQHVFQTFSLLSSQSSKQHKRSTVRHHLHLCFFTALNKGNFKESRQLLGNQVHSENSITWICFLYLCQNIWLFRDSFNDKSKVVLMGLLWLASLEVITCTKTMKTFSSNYEIALSRVWLCQGRPAERILIKVHFQYLPCGRAADGAERILNELLYIWGYFRVSFVSECTLQVGFRWKAPHYECVCLCNVYKLDLLWC